MKETTYAQQVARAAGDPNWQQVAGLDRYPLVQAWMNEMPTMTGPGINPDRIKPVSSDPE